MKPSALFLRKFRRNFLLFNLIISFTSLLFLLPKESFAGSVYFDVPPPSGPNYSVVPTSQAEALCGAPLQCANSHNPGNCNLPACPAGGNDWSKYQLTCVKYFDIEVGTFYDSYYQEAGPICSIGDKCVAGEIGLRAGQCDCGYSTSVYKYCCTSAGNPETCNNNAIQDNSYPDEGQCPGGYIVDGSRVRGSNCIPIAPPPPPPPPTQVCRPGIDTIPCDAGYCSSDNAACATGVQYCLADGSGYSSTCSNIIDNCAQQCSTAPPPPPPVQTCVPFSQGPVCNGGQCTDGTVCAQGHQWCLWDGSDYGECSIEVDNCAEQCTNQGGTTQPDPCGNGVCSSDETCTTCSQDCGACQNIPPPIEPPKAIPNLVCQESVSTNGGNTWSNSVSAQPGQTVQFKMEITNLGSPIDWLAVRNDFDEAVDGFTNLWQNTQPNVPWNIYADQPDELGYPGIYWDSHYEDYGGFGNGAVDTTPWSATLNAGAATFKNYGYGVYGGYAQPWQFNGNFNDRCWSNPDAGSGSTTCLQIVPAPDGGRCNPAWQWCPYNMYAFCNQVTVSTNTVPLPNITLNNSSCTPESTNDLVTVSWAVSSPAVTWVNISTNPNFQGYYHKSVSGTTQTNASSGFNGSPSSGVNGALKFQPGQRYYVRLWNGVRHSDTVEFTAPGVCSPIGSLDNVNCTSVTGWTCDGDDYNNPLQVDFWTKDASGGNAYVGWARANGEREAAVGSACGGNPSHGFTYPTPASLKDGTDHEIYAYGLNLTNTPGTHTLLNGSPKILNCAPIPTSNDRSGPGTSCNGNVAYTGNEARYGQWNNQCNGRIQQAGSNGIGQSCCEQACGADAGCDEEAPNQGNCNAQCGIISSDANRPWIKTTGGDVHSNTGINTPGGP